MQEQGGFHRTRYSMSMSESAHKRNASDSELQDIDADPPKVEDLRKYTAEEDKKTDNQNQNNDDAANADTGVTPMNEDQGFEFDNISKTERNDTTTGAADTAADTTQETKDDNTDNTEKDTTATEAATTNKKGKNKGKDKDNKGKGKGKDKGNKDKGKDKSKRASAKGGKTSKKGGATGAKTAKAAKKAGGKNDKRTSVQSKSAKKSNASASKSRATTTKRESKKGGKNSKDSSKKGNKRVSEKQHKRKVSVSKKPNVKPSNAKKLTQEKKRQSKQLGKNDKKGKNKNKNKDAKAADSGKKENNNDDKKDAGKESDKTADAAATDDSGVSGNGGGNDKGKKAKAWYLSGGSKIKQQSMGAKTRSAYEKTKDAQAKELLRKNNAKEEEMLKIYHLYVRNMNMNVKKDDSSNAAASDNAGNAADNAADTGNNDETSNETSDAAAAGAGDNGGADDEKKGDEDDLYNLPEKMKNVDFGGIVVDVCIEMFILLDESWEGRLDIVDAICDQLIECYEQNNSELYYLKFSKFIFGICHQFVDWRSSMILGMKRRIGKLVQKTPEFFLPFAPHIIRALLPCFAVKIEVLRDAAIDLGETIVQSCHKYDRDHLLLNSILEGLQFKHDFSRCTSAEYLEYMIRSYPVLENGDGTFVNEQLLETIDQCVRLAVKDRALETRTNGYRALHIYEKISPTKSKDIISKFSKAVTRKYKEVISRKNSI